MQFKLQHWIVATVTLSYNTYIVSTAPKHNIHASPYLSCMIRHHHILQACDDICSGYKRHDTPLIKYEGAAILLIWLFLLPADLT